MALTRGRSCGFDSEKFACLHDQVKTTHLMTTNLGNCIPLVMLVTWLNFGEILFETFCCNFFFKFSNVFSRSYTQLTTSQGWLVQLTWNENVLVEYRVNYVTLTFDLTHDLDLGFFKGKFWSSWIVDLIDVKQKGSELIWYRLTTWPCPLTTPMTSMSQGHSLKKPYLRNGRPINMVRKGWE